MKSTLKENLAFFTERYKTVYGDNFIIKPEGVIDNIATSQSLVKMDFEDQLLFVKRNLNPYTAEGLPQDNLYRNVGLKRRQATYTVVQRTISGTAGATILAGSLLVEDTSTNNQFRLKADVTLDSNGIGTGSFQSELIGAINLENDATLEIKTPLADVTGVYYSTGNDINIGLTYESNSEFRKRWLNWSQSNNKMKANLLDLVDNSGDIVIRQNRGLLTYADILTLHTMNIHIYSAEDDNTIAQKIFDNLLDGVQLQGSISITIVDDSNQNVVINFDRATGKNIYVKSTVAKVSDTPNAQVINDVTGAIVDYYTNASFTMGSPVVGNRFNSSIDALNSVDYVVKTEVSLNGSTWLDVATIGDFEVPQFATARVSVVVQ